MLLADAADIAKIAWPFVTLILGLVFLFAAYRVCAVNLPGGKHITHEHEIQTHNLEHLMWLVSRDSEEEAKRAAIVSMARESMALGSKAAYAGMTPDHLSVTWTDKPHIVLLSPHSPPALENGPGPSSE